MTGPKVSQEAEQRLQAMLDTTDGFRIAEMDLELRGPAEFFGTKQAGLPSLRVANIVRDRDLLELAKKEAAGLLADSNLETPKPELASACGHLRSHWNRRYGLVEVG